LNYLESIIEDLNNGETPELCLSNLEAYAEPVLGKLPQSRDEMNNMVNGICAMFYLARYIHLARYYPEGHSRVDLLHKAAGLLPSGALDAPKNDEAIQTVDLEA